MASSSVSCTHEKLRSNSLYHTAYATCFRGTQGLSRAAAFFINTRTWAITCKLVECHHHRHTVLACVLYVACQVAAASPHQVNVGAGVLVGEGGAGNNRGAAAVHFEGAHSRHNDCTTAKNQRWQQITWSARHQRLDHGGMRAVGQSRAHPKRPHKLSSWHALVTQQP